jgi:hypothetical protein
VDLDHLRGPERFETTAEDPTVDLDSRPRHAKIDRVETEGPAAAVVLDLVADLAPKAARASRIDLDVHVDPLRTDTRIQTALCAAQGHGG